MTVTALPAPTTAELTAIVWAGGDTATAPRETPAVPSPADAAPDGWTVVLTCETGTRVAHVDADMMWDGRTPEAIALADVAWRTGVPAEVWAVADVYPYDTV